MLPVQIYQSAEPGSPARCIRRFAGFFTIYHQDIYNLASVLIRTSDPADFTLTNDATSGMEYSVVIQDCPNLRFSLNLVKSLALLNGEPLSLRTLHAILGTACLRSLTPEQSSAPRTVW
ncbi:Uncharacterised protein [Escherichia coli]|uniref:Uncharacterized protein n=1 Tax=Escherichia coli TaxID=562 RepID=A0A376RCR2_ECOLX|nr:Uncharacterised protein [Escherichia coli]